MKRIILTMIIAIIATVGVYVTHAAASTTHSVITTQSVEAISPVMTTHIVGVTSVVIDDAFANNFTGNLTSGNDNVGVCGEQFVATAQSAMTYDNAMAKIGVKEHGVQAPVSEPVGSGRYSLKYPLLDSDHSLDDTF